MKKLALFLLMGIALLITGCSRNAEEIREAAECIPLSEYKTNTETKVVYQVEDVPADCKSLLVSRNDEVTLQFSDVDAGHYLYKTCAWEYDDVYKLKDFFEYILVIPEEKEEIQEKRSMEKLDELIASLDLEQFGSYLVPLHSLETLSQMEYLEFLFIYHADDLSTKFSGNFPALTYLYISDSDVKRLGDIKRITTLQCLELNDHNLITINGIDKLTNLSKLSLMGSEVRSLAPLRTMTQLTALDLSYIGANVNLRYLEDCANLKSLTIYRSYGKKIVGYHSLKKLMNLEQLILVDCDIEEVETLSSLTKLKRLFLTGESYYSDSLKNIAPLVELTELETLILNYHQIEDISPLAGLDKLEGLDISGNQIKDFSPLVGMKSLKRLDISYNPISDVSFLETMTELKGLGLGNWEIKDLSALTNLNKLEKLSLYNTELEDISLISSFPELRYLDISYSNVADITPLAELELLETLYMRHTKVDSILVLYQMGSLRHVDVYGCRLRKIMVDAYEEWLLSKGEGYSLSS